MWTCNFSLILVCPALRPLIVHTLVEEIFDELSGRHCHNRVIVCCEVEGIRERSVCGERSVCRERSFCRERPLCREGSVCAEFERALGILDAGLVVPLLGDEVPFEDNAGEAGAVICSPSGSAAEPALGSSTPLATAFKFAFPAEAGVGAQRRDPHKKNLLRVWQQGAVIAQPVG